MEAQRDATAGRNLTKTIRHVCEGCGTQLPFNYPACIRCGCEPAIGRLRKATLRLSLLVHEARARSTDDLVLESADDAAEPDVASQIPAESTPEEVDIPEPIQFRPSRPKRAWLNFGFLRRAS